MNLRHLVAIGALSLTTPAGATLGGKAVDLPASSTVVSKASGGCVRVHARDVDDGASVHESENVATGQIFMIETAGERLTDLAPLIGDDNLQELAKSNEATRSMHAASRQKYAVVKSAHLTSSVRQVGGRVMTRVTLKAAVPGCFGGAQ